MRAEYLIGGVLAVLLIGGGAVLLLGGSPAEMMREVAGEPYHEIADPSGFVNTEPLTIGELVGEKVILVDFLTYSCINCQRTFPYLTAWYDRYRDQGLEIVGIHTPEFAFEKDIDNVRAAMERFGIEYPIVLDNNYATWRAYDNHYWPRKYLIDIHGNIVYDHIGEGGYAETERKIQQLLAERAAVLGVGDTNGSQGLVADTIAGRTSSAQSPETYFGAARNEYLGNGTPGRVGTSEFSVPANPTGNRLYLDGTWHVQQEYASAGAGAGITYPFLAQEVYFVAESPDGAEVAVYVDGELVDTITIQASGLYTLVELDTPGPHVLELQITDGTVRAYTFTFG